MILDQNLKIFLNMSIILTLIKPAYFSKLTLCKILYLETIFIVFKNAKL